MTLRLNISGEEAVEIGSETTHKKSGGLFLKSPSAWSRYDGIQGQVELGVGKFKKKKLKS